MLQSSNPSVQFTALEGVREIGAKAAPLKEVLVELIGGKDDGVSQQAIAALAAIGPGVAEGDRALIVRRFGRLERSRSTSGFGLGLSFVAAAAHRHCGVLTFADADPGLIAILDLPLRAHEEGHGVPSNHRG